jgi:hypothetical protein
MSTDIDGHFSVDTNPQDTGAVPPLRRCLH